MSSFLQNAIQRGLIKRLKVECPADEGVESFHLPLVDEMQIFNGAQEKQLLYVDESFHALWLFKT